MEVILTSVSSLGNIGDRVKVKGGYGRNYLIPNSKAVAITEDNLKYFESIREELEKEAKIELEAAQSVAKEMQKLKLLHKAKVSEGDAIFGSVNVSDVLTLINEKFPEVCRKQVSLVGGTVRTIGVFDVVIVCHRDVKVNLELKVVDINDPDGKKAAKAKAEKAAKESYEAKKLADKIIDNTDTVSNENDEVEDSQDNKS